MPDEISTRHSEEYHRQHNLSGEHLPFGSPEFGEMPENQTPPPNAPPSHGGVKGALTKQYGPLPGWGWIVVIVGGVAVWMIVRRSNIGGGSANALVPVDTSIPTTSGGGGGGGGGDNTPPITNPNPTPTPSPVPVTGGGGSSGSGILLPFPLPGSSVLPSLESQIANQTPGVTPFTLAAGVAPGTTATPEQSNTIWTAISKAVAGLLPNALVKPLNIQGTAAVPNSAAPEQVATASQYQALVLGQFPGGTGQYAPGAPVDVSKGYTPQLQQYTVSYLENVIKSGQYNPDMPAIGNQKNTASLLYSMTNDPKYLTPQWTGQHPGVQSA